MFACQRGEEVELCLVHTVGTRGDDESFHPWVSQRFDVAFPQQWQRGISVAVGLEIGHIAHRLTPGLEASALLSRALLCYGGEDSYLLPAGRTRLCFPDSRDPDFGFRRLLWEDLGGRRALFLQLLDDLDENQPAAPQLQQIISRKVFRGDERWKEYFVTMPEILSSVRLSGAEVADPMGEWVFRTEKRLIRMNHPDDILLLSRTQTSSVSREYYSYVLFLKARQQDLPVFYHADYTEASEKYAWFEDIHGAHIRILYRNPDGTRWRCLAYREEDSSSVFDGSLEEMLDYIRESSK